MTTKTLPRRLDFGPAGMWWEIYKTGADTGGACLEALNVVSPDFGGPPLHVHPNAAESYSVTEGVLDVCIDGTWQQVRAGETANVPAGVPHTVRNTSGAEVRLINRHEPALDFERFFRRLHAMAAAGQVTLPPRGLAAAIRLSMLFTEHAHEIYSVKPPRAAMRVLATMGRLAGFRLPEVPVPT